MSVINDLPKNLEDAVPTILEKWLSIGLNTETADRHKAEMGCDLAYEAIGLTPPKLKMWLQSPREGVVASMLLNGAMQSRLKLSAQCRNNILIKLKTHLSDSLRDQIKSELIVPLASRIWDQIGAHIWDQICSEFETLEYESNQDNIGRRLKKMKDMPTDLRFKSHFIDQTFMQISAQLKNQIIEKSPTKISDHISLANYGQHDGFWLGYLSALKELVPEIEKISGLMLVAENCGWWWRFDKTAIFTDRPQKLSFDENHKLHCEDGPAIEYRDGFKVYAWHGIRIDADLIENKNAITFERISNEPNTEIALCMIEIIGQDKFLKQCNAEKVHEDEWGKLWRADIGHDQPYMAVEVVNSTPEPDGTFKTYFLSVHPELRPIPDVEEGEFEYGEPQELTALNAVASTFGLRGEEYKPHIET